MDKIKVKVILGSTREGRFGDKPAGWIMDELKKNDSIEAELLDLREYPLPMFNQPQGPSQYGENYPSEDIAKWGRKIAEADAFIMTVAEYNHGYTAVLKNALDHAYVEWNNKPVAFFGYGSAVGGSRAVEQLRLVAIELQMVPIRNAVYVANYWGLLDEKGNLKIESFQAGLDGLVSQLLWWARALKGARDATK